MFRRATTPAYRGGQGGVVSRFVIDPKLASLRSDLRKCLSELDRLGHHHSAALLDMAIQRLPKDAAFPILN
jgi:hypothetical protein